MGTPGPSPQPDGRPPRWPWVATLVVLPLAAGVAIVAAVAALDALLAEDFAGRDDALGWTPVLAGALLLAAAAAGWARRRRQSPRRALAAALLSVAALAVWTLAFLLAWLVILVVSCVGGDSCLD